MTARCYACPACGGQVEERARSCPYCHAPVATARCCHCYHMNIPDAVHCSGCGRKLGLEPVGEPDTLVCPDCKQPFALFSGGPGRLHDCQGCGAQFVDHELLRDLLERREVYGSVAPRRPTPENPLSQAVRYVPCPVCERLMNRKNFGGSSGIIVDVCAKHGTWFDAGELPRVLAFVEAGGLAKAKEREAEEQRKARIKARMAELSLGSGGSAHSVSGAEANLIADLTGAGQTLLSFVRDLLRSG